MPVTPTYPGVYIQEVPSGVRTITGVATSIAAFFGRASKGPLNTAVRCLSPSDYVRAFGAPQPQSDLSASVMQFFTNGGSDCYVVRLADGTAAPASVTLHALSATAAAGPSVLNVTAKSAGVWGNGIRLEVDYLTNNPGETFNLRAVQEEGGREVARESFENLSMDPSSPRFAPAFVTLGSQLITVELDSTLDPTTGSFTGFSEARRPLGATAAAVRAAIDAFINTAGHYSFEISVDGSDYAPVSLSTLTAVPAGTAAIASAIADRANAALAALVPARRVLVALTAAPAPNNQFFLRFTADTPGGDNASVRVRRAPSHDLAADLLLGAENGGIELARRSNFRPAPNGTVLRLDDNGGSLNRLNALTVIPANGLTNVQVGTEAAIGLGMLNTTGTDTDPWFMDGTADDRRDGVRQKIGLIARAIANAPGSRYTAEAHGYQIVIRPKDGPPNETTGDVTFAGPSAATGNQWLSNTRQYPLGGAPTTFATGAAGGQDGGAPRFANYVGDPSLKTGFNALDRVDIFNLMILPRDADLTDAERGQIWGPASVYCRQRRAFLLVDAPDTWTDAQGLPVIVQDVSPVNALRATVVKDYSAVFYPKIRINDRGLVRTMSPGGSLAGLFARTDASRGVWKAPAGTEADLRGILGLDVRLTDNENGVLNKVAVNCMRSFISGFVSWGSRTMDGADDIGSEWKYIAIRRLALYIEESLYRGTQWVVFEPNDEPLWANIRLNVGVFMNRLFRQGAFQGSTPDQAYYVKCDAETTTQADRNLGIVNIEVGFAPLKPAEFVIITIKQIAGALQ